MACHAPSSVLPFQSNFLCNYRLKLPQTWLASCSLGAQEPPMAPYCLPSWSKLRCLATKALCNVLAPSLLLLIALCSSLPTPPPHTHTYTPTHTHSFPRTKLFPSFPFALSVLVPTLTLLFMPQLSVWNASSPYILIIHVLHSQDNLPRCCL